MVPATDYRYDSRLGGRRNACLSNLTIVRGETTVDTTAPPLPKPAARRSIEPLWERLIYYLILACLATIFFLCVIVGSGILGGLFSSRTITENALLFHKLASMAGGVAALGGIGAAFILFAQLLRNLVLRVRQARFDRVATRMLHVLEADPAARVPDFVVYLRAFEVTGRLSVPLYLRFTKMVAMGNLTVNDVESYVSKAAKRLGPVVALGRPGEAFGAGRVVTPDAEWKQDILLLLRRARSILLIPSHRPGTLWEIESIQREGLLEKCIFIMPPQSKKVIDTAERWAQAKAAAEKLGIELPEYQHKGLLFTLSTAGKVSGVESLTLGSTGPLRRAIKRLMNPSQPVPLFEAVAQADRRWRRSRYLGWAMALYYMTPFILAGTNLFLPPLYAPPRDESWGLTFDRIVSYRTLSDYDLGEWILFKNSVKYVSWAANKSSEQIDHLRPGLTIKGLFRLDDDTLRVYYVAQADMLERTDPATCAAYASGQGSPPVTDVFSYIPPNEIGGFLHARTEAMLSEIEDRALPPIDNKVIATASQRFMQLLTPVERARWDRLNGASGDPSPSDSCWMVTKMYSGVRQLPAPLGANWARGITAMVIQAREKEQSPDAVAH